MLDENIYEIVLPSTFSSTLSIQKWTSLVLIYKKNKNSRNAQESKHTNIWISLALLAVTEFISFCPFVHLIRFVGHDFCELLPTSPFIMGYLNICAANFISPFTRLLLYMYDALGSWWVRYKSCLGVLDYTSWKVPQMSYCSTASPQPAVSQAWMLMWLCSAAERSGVCAFSLFPGPGFSHPLLRRVTHSYADVILTGTFPVPVQHTKPA